MNRFSDDQVQFLLSLSPDDVAALANGSLINEQDCMEVDIRIFDVLNSMSPETMNAAISAIGEPAATHKAKLRDYTKYSRFMEPFIAVINKYPTVQFVALYYDMKPLLIGKNFDLGYCPLRIYTMDAFAKTVNVSALTKWINDGKNHIMPGTYNRTKTSLFITSYSTGDEPVTFNDRPFSNLEIFDGVEYTNFIRFTAMTFRK